MDASRSFERWLAGNTRVVKADLDYQPPDWLKVAARKMARAVTADWKAWRAAWRRAAA